MVDIEKIQKKYAMDSKGAFGNVKNPVEKSALRSAAKARGEVNSYNRREQGGRENFNNADKLARNVSDELFKLQNFVLGNKGLTEAAIKVSNALKNFRTMLSMKGKGGI